MTPFADLTPSGRARRLRRMALAALGRYDVDVVGLRLVDNGHNAVFRVDAADGRRYALRINAPGHRTLTEVRAEAWWLGALSRETDLVVPAPVAMGDGGLVGTVEIAGVPQPRHHVLFTWLPGRHPAGATPPLAATLGELLARLHRHADTLVPPPGFSTTRRDDPWPFGVPAAVYADDPDERFPTERRVVFREAAARIGGALAELHSDPADLRFLHFDLHLGNVKTHRGVLQPLDFDACLWAHPAQDIGVALFYLERRSFAGDPADEALRVAFRRGYERHRPWPARDDATLDPCVAARCLDFLNFALRSDEPYFAAILPDALARTETTLRRWLRQA